VLAEQVLFKPARQRRQIFAGRRGASRVEARPVAGAVEIVVRDEGPGIPAEALDRLFHKFYRADARGSPARRDRPGGLPIAKGFVEALGGTIAGA